MNTLATNGVDTEQQGANVNNQINIDNFNVTNKTFDPNHSDYSNLNADFSVNGKVKEGDYFTVQYPEHVTVNGDVNYEKLGNLMKLKPLTNADGDVVATGVYDVNSKVVKYTFTNYVNDRNNIKGNFRLPIFIDRKTIPNSGNYYSSFNIAGKDYSETLNINYDSPVQGISDDNGFNISSFITDIDLHSGSNDFKQTIYVNPMQHDLYNSNVRIQGYQTDQNKSSTIIDKNTKFKIYRVNDTKQLSESHYNNPNSSNLVDVTNDFDGWITYNDDNSVNIQFGDINNAYVIQVGGKYDAESGQNVKTRVAETNENC